MERDELAAWLRLSLSPGIGNARARKLLAAFGLPQAIFEQSATALAQVLGSAQVAALQSPPQQWAGLVERTWAWLQDSPAQAARRQVVSLGDTAYPQALLTLDDPPLLLYLLGQASFKNNQTPALLNQGLDASLSDASGRLIDAAACLAMVGSRNPTPQGVQTARRFAQAFAQSGLTVVSGLALGIDGAAHEGALQAADTASQALTVAVVGTGLDRVYPRSHLQLAHRIAAHGLIISEYPLGTPPLNANFPKRNRLIAGLCRGTLVVEAALQSGSLITARLCAEQGKEVFAIPGSIHAAQSRGCHALIKQGAKLVESAEDVLEELPGRGAMGGATAQPAAPTDAAGAEPALPGEDAALLDAMGFDPVGLDALQARTGLDTAALQAELMALELQDRLARLPGGLYQRLAR